MGGVRHHGVVSGEGARTGWSPRGRVLPWRPAMPRHLLHALASLRATPTLDTESVRWDTDATLSPEDVRARYFMGVRGLHAVGEEVPVEARRLAVTLWRELPAARDALWWVMLGAPCDEFERTVEREVRLGRRQADMLAWLRERPGLAHSWRRSVRDLALRGETVWHRVDAGLSWLRYLDGGDDALSAIARALIREDIRQAKREFPSTFHRHDLEDHGTVTPEEGARLNNWLLRFNADPLGDICSDTWWSGAPPDTWRAPSRRLSVLERFEAWSRAYAADRWSTADDAFYAAARARLSAAGPAPG